ncbi:MAG: hypothetical protein EOP84_18640, partial [Verrucomicrobiaceae bacterium]
MSASLPPESPQVLRSGSSTLFDPTAFRHKGNKWKVALLCCCNSTLLNGLEFFRWFSILRNVPTNRFPLKYPSCGVAVIKLRSTLVLLLCLRLFTVSLCAIPIEVIKHLGGADTGQNPRGALTQGGDGFFYGTARDGGRYGYGTVYRISGDGVMTTLYDFDDTKGRFPQGALIPRSDGNFYGTTQYGGAGGNGTVFKVTRSGLLTTVASFSGPNGREPAGGLLLASDGCLYGVTIGGGPQNNGTVFRVQPDDSFSTIASFSYTTNLLEWALDGIGLKPGKPDAELLTRPAIVEKRPDPERDRRDRARTQDDGVRDADRDAREVRKALARDHGHEPLHERGLFVRVVHRHH